MRWYILPTQNARVPPQNHTCFNWSPWQYSLTIVTKNNFTHSWQPKSSVEIHTGKMVHECKVCWVLFVSSTFAKNMFLWWQHPGASGPCAMYSLWPSSQQNTPSTNSSCVGRGYQVWLKCSIGQPLVLGTDPKGTWYYYWTSFVLHGLEHAFPIRFCLVYGSVYFCI